MIMQLHADAIGMVSGWRNSGAAVLAQRADGVGSDAVQTTGQSCGVGRYDRAEVMGSAEADYTCVREF